MSLILTTVKATCPVCGEQKAQIDTSRERAVQVVTDAMNAHIAKTHPEPRDSGHAVDSTEGVGNVK